MKLERGKEGSISGGLLFSFFLLAGKGTKRRFLWCNGEKTWVPTQKIPEISKAITPQASDTVEARVKTWLGGGGLQEYLFIS